MWFSIFLENAWVKRVTETLSVNRMEGLFALSASLQHSQASGWGFMLTARISLGKDTRTNRWYYGARSFQNQGAASARAFLDTKGDGVFGEGDTPIKDVHYSVNGAQSQQATEEDGVAFLSYLPSQQEAAVEIDPTSLEDPLMKPSGKGVRFVPRAGTVLRLDFPVIMTGEVTGTVTLKEAGKTREFPGLTLEMVDAQGKLAKKVRTGYDGYFYFSEIPPGLYKLRVAPEQKERLKIVLPEPKEVLLEPSGTIRDGLNFTVVRDEAPEAKPQEAPVPMWPYPPPLNPPPIVPMRR